MEYKDNSEIISRRAFFRKAISKGLPFLMGIYASPMLFSCSEENDELESMLNSNGCTGSACSSTCSEYCKK